MAMFGSFELMAFGKFTLVLMFAWIGNRLLSNFNPRLLVAWWRACAVAILLCVVSLMAPAWFVVQVPTDSMSTARKTSAETASTLFSPDGLQNSHETKAISQAPMSREWRGELVSRMDTEDPHQAASTLNPVPPVAYLEAALQSEVSPNQISFSSLESRTIRPQDILGAIVVIAWGVGVLVGVSSWILGWCYLVRLQARATLPNSTLMSTGKRFAHKYQLKRVPRILCAPVEIPCVLGIIRPVILLPESITRDHADKSQIEVALSHEMAHIAERDLWWDSLYRIIAILAWPHPFVWRMPAAHRTACEHVCDLNAADVLGNRELYATQLARMALALHTSQNSPMLMGLAARPDILNRLALLRRGKPSPKLHARHKIALGLLPCAALLLAALSFTPVRAQQETVLEPQPDETVLAESHPETSSAAAAEVPAQVQAVSPGIEETPLPNKSLPQTVNVTQEPASEAPGNESKPQTVLPAATYYESALRVQVGAPEEDIRLALVPEVSGQVVSAAGKPVANVAVAVVDSVAFDEWHTVRWPQRNTPRNNDPQVGLLQVAMSDANGRFSFSQLKALPESDRAQSEFRLRFYAVSPNDEVGRQSHFVDRNLPLRAMKIVLHDMAPAHTIQYCDRRGEPIAGAIVSIFEFRTFERNEPQLRNNMFFLWPFKLNLTTDSAGQCALPKLPRNAIVDISFKHDDWMIRRIRVHTFTDSETPTLHNKLNQHYQRQFADREKHSASPKSLQEFRAIWENELKVVEHPLHRESRVVASGFDVWHGQVVAPDGTGVAATLHVFLQADGRWELTRTDEEGRFSVKLPQVTESNAQPAKSISIRVTSDDPERYLGTSIELSPTDLRNNHPLRIELRRPQLVSGQVLTVDDHQPIEGIQVSVSSGEPPSREGPYALAETTADGRFSLQLRPGKYELHLATSTTGIDLPTTSKFPWYGNPPESQPSRKMLAFEVKSDAAIELEPMLVARTKPVSVRVLDASGRPVENAEVTLMRIAVWASDSGTLTPERLAPFAEPVVTDAQGRCSVTPFSSLGTEVVMTATHKNTSGVSYGEKTMQYVPSTPIEIRLEPAALISGKLTKNGKPIAAATIALSEPGRKVVSMDAGRLTTKVHERSLYHREFTKTNADGEYQLIAPAGKHYQIEYSQDSLSSPTTVEVVFSSALAGTASINLVSGTSKVSGTIQTPEGEPLADASVSLKMPEDFKHVFGYERRSFVADAAGRFAIPELPSGKYRVKVVHRNSSWPRDQDFELETGRNDQVLRLQSR